MSKQVVDVKQVQKAIGELCCTCGLPGAWHFRGNGSRYVGCAGALVMAHRKKQEKPA